MTWMVSVEKQPNNPGNRFYLEYRRSGERVDDGGSDHVVELSSCGVDSGV